MSDKLVAPKLADCLIEEGLVPEGCGDVEVSMPVGGPLTLSYRVFVHDVDLEKFSRAFVRATKDG